jgi:hypothetical protein
VVLPDPIEPVMMSRVSVGGIASLFYAVRKFPLLAPEAREERNRPPAVLRKGNRR